MDQHIAVGILEVNDAIDPPQLTDRALGHRPEEGVGVVDVHQVSGEGLEQVQGFVAQRFRAVGIRVGKGMRVHVSKGCP